MGRTSRNTNLTYCVGSWESCCRTCSCLPGTWKTTFAMAVQKRIVLWWRRPRLSFMANERAGLEKLSLRGLQRLVRNADLLFKRIELRIAVNFPPLPFGDCIARLRGFPLARFLVIRRYFCRGPGILRPDRATGEQKRSDAQGSGPAAPAMPSRLEIAIRRWPTSSRS